MRDRFILMGFIPLILAGLLYSVIGLLSLGREEPPMAVTVIVSDSSSDRWKAFREGLAKGAQEERVVLNILTTARFSDIEEECGTISREAGARTDALIIEPVGEDEEHRIEEAAGPMPVVLAVSGLRGSSLPWIGVDAQELGHSLAREVIEGSEGAEEKPLIGLLSGNQSQENLALCRDTLTKELEENGLSIGWELDERKASAQGMLALYLEAKIPDVLVCLDDHATEDAIDALQAKGREKTPRIYAVGRSEKAIYYLDAGLIECLAVPDEYEMGYLCVKELAGKIHSSKERRVTVVLATRENLFSPRTDQILFPVVR